MSEHLYRDFGAARYRPTDERLGSISGGFSPHSQLLQPLAVLTNEVMERRYQSTPENSLSLDWYVKADIDTQRDHKTWESVVVPAGETLDLFKHLPGWNVLQYVGVLVGCGSNAGLADISIVSYDDTGTDIAPVAAGVDLSVVDEQVAAIEAATMGLYIKRDAHLLLKISITPPFTDADGNGVFVKNAGTGCEERACIKLMVHAHLRNMCFKEVLRGCNLEDYGCGDCQAELPDDPCAPETLNDDFTGTPVEGALGGVVGNVVANDTVGGEPVDLTVQTLSLVDDGGSGITLDPATGDLTAPAGTAPGMYTITYMLCEDPANPATCSTSTADVVVS